MPPDTLNNIPARVDTGANRGVAAVRQPSRGGLFQASAAAWLCGAFTLAVAVTMLVSHAAARQEDPLNSPKLKDLKEQLREEPANEKLKESIRQLDLVLRERHFRHLSRMNSGVWLLLIGSGLFVIAARRAAPAKRIPLAAALLQKPDASALVRTARFGRWAVAGAGALCGVGLFWISASTPKSALSSIANSVPDPNDPATAQSNAPDCATPAELAASWPLFRGPSAGFTSGKNLPVAWDAEAGSGIAWKVPSPCFGFNSPIVFGGNVYFSGGDASKIEVVCLRLADGQVVWRQPLENVSGAPAQPPEIPESTGYAPASMATDGRRVYAMFANGNMGAWTLDGKPSWARGFGALQNAYGHATSLATWMDRVIVQLDQGESDSGKSVLYALDGRTGRPVWQRPRKLGASWASPIVIEAAGKTQIITLSLPWVIAYSAADGAELWRAECLNGEVTPSPIFTAGMVLIASPSDRLLAIRPDGTGDVTKTHVAWTSDENIPDVTSPVSDGELVFMTTTSGTVTCLDVKDGKTLWVHELEMECHASPVIGAKKVYQFTQDGTAVVMEAGREHKEVFRGKLPDSFHATPALLEDKIIVRGMTNIWCIGAPGTGGAR